MKQFIVISLIIAVGYAELDKAFKETMFKKISNELEECIKKEMVTKEDIDEFVGNSTITRRGAKCLAACINEKEEIQDGNGKLSLDGALRAIEVYKTADADIYSKLKQISTRCIEKVGDLGDRCETAIKYVECIEIMMAQVGLPQNFLDV